MRKLILFSALALFVFATVGCEKNKEEQKKEEKEIPIVGTWKCIGFGNTKTGKVRPIESQDCKKCYIITFKEDGTFTAKSRLKLSGKYKIEGEKIKYRNLSETFFQKIGEMGDGDDFRKFLTESSTYNLHQNSLKLFYSKTEYLLFNLKNR